MAKISYSVFDPAPKHIWGAVRNHQFRMEEYIKIQVENNPINYFPLSQLDSWQTDRSTDITVQPVTFSYWVEEMEERGCIGLVDRSNIFIFTQNVPLKLRKLVAYRYFLLGKDVSLNELCERELTFVLKQNDPYIDQYSEWLLTEKGMYSKTEDLNNWHNNFSTTLYAHPDGPRAMLDSILRLERAKRQ